MQKSLFGIPGPTLTNAMHEYCKVLDYDIMGLTELHNNQHKPQFAGKHWICSDLACEEDGKSTDPAAGVAILLSCRMAHNILSKGHVGTRIAWVRLKGWWSPSYVPHKGRTATPTVTDTIEALGKLLTTVPKQDCIIMGGDLNCQLQRNVPGCTGRWSMTQKDDNGHGENILDLMRAHDLFAAGTMFKPARKKWDSSARKRVCNASYLDKDCKKDHGS